MQSKNTKNFKPVETENKRESQWEIVQKKIYRTKSVENVTGRVKNTKSGSQLLTISFGVGICDLLE